MQKALVQMNVQLPLVVSDITGVTGLRILRDIVAGQRDPHSSPRIATTLPRLAGRDHRRVDRQLPAGTPLCLATESRTLRHVPAQLAACDRAIEGHLQRLTATPPATATPLPAPACHATPADNDPAFDLRTPLYHLTGGIDLTQIDGIAALHGAQAGRRNRHRHDALAHRETFHVLAHPRPQEQHLGRPLAQLAHRTVGQSRRRHPTHGRHESRSDPNGAGRLLSTLAGRIGKPQAITATARKLASSSTARSKASWSTATPARTLTRPAPRPHPRRPRQTAATLGFDLVDRQTGDMFRRSRLIGSSFLGGIQFGLELATSLLKHSSK